MEKDIMHANFHKFYTPKFNDTQELRLLRVENTLDTILSKIDFIDHHNEHELMTLQDGLDNLKSKIDSIEPKEGGDNSENVKEIVDKVCTNRLFIYDPFMYNCFIFIHLKLYLFILFLFL